MLDVEYIEIIKGGPGSGYHDHPGRPGEVGGSRPRDAGGGEVEGARSDGGDAEVRVGSKAILEMAKRDVHRVAERHKKRGAKKLEGMMVGVAEWIAKVMSSATAARELRGVASRYVFAALKEQTLLELHANVTEVHEPRSRDLHVDPGAEGAEIIDLEIGSSRFVFGLEDSTGKRAVYKLAAGEESGLRDGIPAGTSARREVAVSRIADILGLTGDAEGAKGWRVVRSDFIGDGVEGSVTEWVDHEEQGGKVTILGVDTKVVREIALFDMLIGNTDRHVGNLMMDTDSTVVCIDHGLALGEQWGAGLGGNHAVWDRALGRLVEAGDWQITDTEREMGMRLLEHEEELYAMADEVGLDKKVIDGVLERADALVDSETWSEMVRRLEKIDQVSAWDALFVSEWLEGRESA